MSDHHILSTAFARVRPMYVQQSTAREGRGRRHRVLATLALASLAGGWQPAHAATCSLETLSSILLSQPVPLALFSNPNGNPLTTAELDEIQTTILSLRSTLGEVSSLVALRNPTLPRSLDITVGANVKLNGYAFSPRTYDAQTGKVGNVVITFATDYRAEDCKVFWMRVSIPATSTPSNHTNAMQGA